MGIARHAWFQLVTPELIGGGEFPGTGDVQDVGIFQDFVREWGKGGGEIDDTNGCLVYDGVSGWPQNIDITYRAISIHGDVHDEFAG